MLKTIIILLLSLLISRICQAGESITLHFPLDCQLGTNCFIQNYADADPTTDYHDYTCGYLSYDGHNGTDFRLPTLKSMHDGVKVLAAAPGVVRAIRDGMPDISVKKIDKSLIKDREAGNSVAIRHDNGWETQYSHLREGSVLVKAGDHVQTGQPLGLAGLSGNTEFPHLHFTVRHKGKVIDPFTGNNIGAGCGNPADNSLWDKSITGQLEYQASGILAGGFTGRLPEIKPYHEYLANQQSLPDNTGRIIFWVHAFGLQKDDTLQLTIISPTGNIVAKNNVVMENNEAQRLSVIGKPLRDKAWPAGKYQGIYSLSRNDGGDVRYIINETFHLDVVSATD